MSDNRKYYYLKLKESYFDDDAIVLLESMQCLPVTVILKDAKDRVPEHCLPARL